MTTTATHLEALESAQQKFSAMDISAIVESVGRLAAGSVEPDGDDITRVYNKLNEVLTTALTEESRAYIEELQHSCVEVIARHIDDTLDEAHSVLNSRTNKNVGVIEKHINAFWSKMRKVEQLVEQYGLYTWYRVGPGIHAVATELRGTLNAAKVELARIAKLREQQDEATVVAVRESLCSALEGRRRSLFQGRLCWAVASVVVLVGACLFGWLFAGEVVGLLSTQEGELQKFAVISILVRSIVIVPVGITISFVLVQYGRERRFEETYAHKTAVADSLVPFANLLHADSAPRANMLREAMLMVFEDPTLPSHREQPGLLKRVFGKKYVRDLETIMAVCEKHGISLRRRIDETKIAGQ